MSKIKNGGLDQYGTEPFEQFGTAGVEGVKQKLSVYYRCVTKPRSDNIFTVLLARNGHLVVISPYYAWPPVRCITAFCKAARSDRTHALTLFIATGDICRRRCVPQTCDTEM